MKKRFNRRRFLEISAGTTLAAATLGRFPVSALAAISTAIALNGSASGRVFDGIGAISGGGGNSRLLIDYPEPYRTQILDYLFKPDYGANLHILKVEVGGDTNSTDGSEPSFMHTATDQNFNRGYEWWLMGQAKARNPNIKLYGLAWGAPGWIGTTGATVFDSNNRIWSQDMVNYYLAWIKGASSQHGLTIDYLGGWNERGYNKQFYEALHSALASNGLSTKIVGADSGWDVADAMIADATFNSSIDIVGVHYPCTGGDGGSATSCPNTSNARSLGKPLWASENGSQDQNSGAIPMARAINRGYIDGLMTAYINWPLIAAIYPNLPYSTVGLMVANQPWSGNYSVGKQLWVTAHTTQFTQPGWKYIDSACGYLGGSASNGSYVTIKSNSTTDYSVILETVDATASQTVSFQISNGLSTGAVSVWATNLNSSNSSDYFARQTSITPASGAYSLTLLPGYIYTLSTTTGQGKGTILAPPAAALSLPYADNFESYAVGREALYFSDQNGSFEIATAGGGRTGKVMRQMSPIAPHNWDNPSNPYTLFGELAWIDYTVSCDVLLEQSGAAELLGRVGTQQGFSPANINAYYLRVSSGGAWSILKNTTGGTVTTLASGSIAAPGLNTWYNLSLTFAGTTLTAKINGTTVGTITDSSYSAGQVGVGVDGWQNAQFDNFSITSTSTAATGTYYTLVNVNSGLVLDVTGSSTASGGLIVQATSSGATSQQWRLVAAGGGYYTLVNHNSGLVLEVPNQSTTAGVQLDQRSSNSGTNQQWQFVGASNGSYTIANRNSGLLVDVSANSTASGATVIQWSSNGGANQQWRLLAVPTAGVTYELVNRNSGKVMDVNAASTANGGAIIQYTDHGGSNQQWRLSDAGSGYFTLVNLNSNLVLDVPNASSTAGLQLEQWSSNGGTNQQWLFSSVGGGYYTVKGRGSSLFVAVSGSSTVDIAAIVQAAADGGTEQQWLLSPV
ncbi:MAG TPA: RICIN domain-containing protein [Ktedonobacteraceae bacterium]